MNAFQRRFGALGECVSGIIQSFSMDVIGMILAYVMCDLPKQSNTPKLWNELNYFDEEDDMYDPTYVDVTFNREHHTIWWITNRINRVLDMDQNELFRLERPFPENPFQEQCHSCAFYQDRVYCTTTDASQLYVFNATNGRFIYTLSLQNKNVWDKSCHGIQILFNRIVIGKINEIEFYDYNGYLYTKRNIEGSIGDVYVTKNEEVLTTTITTTMTSSKSCIQVLNRNGDFKRTMNLAVKHAFRLTGDPWDHLIFCDRPEYQVIVLNDQGERITQIKLEWEPFSCCVDSEGKYWVATENCLEIYTW